jgi:glucose dehydrogenase
LKSHSHAVSVAAANVVQRLHVGWEVDFDLEWVLFLRGGPLLGAGVSLGTPWATPWSTPSGTPSAGLSGPGAIHILHGSGGGGGGLAGAGRGLLHRVWSENKVGYRGLSYIPG